MIKNLKIDRKTALQVSTIKTEEGMKIRIELRRPNCETLLVSESTLKQCLACGEYYVDNELTNGLCGKCFNKLTENGWAVKEETADDGILSLFNTDDIESALIEEDIPTPRVRRYGARINYGKAEPSRDVVISNLDELVAIPKKKLSREKLRTLLAYAVYGYSAKTVALKLKLQEATVLSDYAGLAGAGLVAKTDTGYTVTSKVKYTVLPPIVTAKDNISEKYRKELSPANIARLDAKLGKYLKDWASINDLAIKTKLTKTSLAKYVYLLGKAGRLENKRIPKTSAKAYRLKEAI